jgi:hypothetical protein
MTLAPQLESATLKRSPGPLPGGLPPLRRDHSLTRSSTSRRLHGGTGIGLRVGDGLCMGDSRARFLDSRHLTERPRKAPARFGTPCPGAGPDFENPPEHVQHT